MICIFLSSFVALPQSVQIDYYTAPGGDRETLGHSTAALGDINGDGIPDFVAVGDGFVNGGVPASVRVFSGATGNQIYGFQRPSGLGFGMNCSALGDLDGDAVQDFFVGEPFANGSTGIAWIYSGQSGQLIEAMDGPVIGARFGSQAEDVGDLDGDQVSEFAIAASGIDEILIYSGRTRQPILTLLGTPTQESLFGNTMAGDLDFNGDGTPDLVVGNHVESRLAASGGSIRVFSLADGSILFEEHGPLNLGLFGRQVITLNDQNGDGRRDFAVTRYKRRMVEVRDGGSGAVIYSIREPALPTFTRSLVNVGDVNGDLLDDFGVSAPLASQGTGYQARGLVFVYSFNGDTLLALEGDDNETLGWGMSALGDIDGDGLVEIAVGGPGYVSVNRDDGRVWVVSVDPDVGTEYCSGVVNSTGRAASAQALGSSFVKGTGLTLRGAGLPSLSFAFWITGVNAGFNTNPGGSFGNLCLASPIGRFVGQGEVQNTGLDGEVELAIDLSDIPQPGGFVSGAAGEIWRFQLWYRDSLQGQAGSNFSEAVAVTLR